MKNTIYLFGIFITLIAPKLAMANNSIAPEDFRYLVCSYVEDSSSLEDALTKIDNIADNLLLSNSQEQDLENLEAGTLSSEVYCIDLEF